MMGFLLLCPYAIFSKNHNKKLYVLVDEYDTQLNHLLRFQESPLTKALSLETAENEDKMSSFRRFFSKLKEAHRKNSKNLRSVIAGVCPLALNSFTSGFNIARDITHAEKYSDLCGITKKDLEEAIKQLNYSDKTVNLLDLMINNYNGYTFHPDQEEELINPTLASYFLDHIITYGKLPERMLDKNTSISDNSLQLILKSPITENLVTSLMTTGKYDLTKDIDAKIMMSDLMTKEHTLVQLLFHFGTLTFCKKKKNQLTIPNDITYKEYLQAILEISKLEQFHE